MSIEESFEHLEAKISQAVKTINRLRKERERIKEENRKLRALLDKQDQETKALRADSGDMRRRMQEHRLLIANKEQIVSHIKGMLDKLNAVQR